MSEENTKNIDNSSADERIKKVLSDLRPFLNMEGGDVEFVKYDETCGCLYVKLTGACAMCTFQDDTLELDLLEAIKEEVPEVREIMNVPL